MRPAALIAAALLALSCAAPTRADPLDNHDCFGKDMMRRITGCTELLQRPGLDPVRKATALATRALALSILGRYEDAIRDYNLALSIVPNYPVALNNRAWAKFKLGRIAEAEPDVEKSLRLDRTSPHAHDTRAHVRQWQGRQKEALRDYRVAMVLGGARMVKLYQCGLQAHGLYLGPLSGIVTEALEKALGECVKTTKCDPLPPDEECKASLS
ncbi:MAG: tetratricopeptide repeat protein [Hyphomicrobiaceae bacterium]|nr:tetratricopeptide repeat protein [Hyphomicrobiaceae bacterium]